jgi:WD40 repeat protein/energy-coupling factor transporter ATP-binding protein EcfA2
MPHLAIRGASLMPQPVFISYAHNDHAVVSKIIAALQGAEIPVWIDHQKLKPGTSNWEHSIRDAIAVAPVFILVASPNTVLSQYVPDEISIAQLRTPPIPIIPVWIAGKNYIEAVPMGMGRVQGLDLREAAFETNIGELIAILREVTGAEKRISSQYILPVPVKEDVPSDFVPHNPYQGLEAFTEKTSRYYFGRTALINTLADRVQKDRFLAVIGASGSGKSSVVMAGLLPRLRRDHPEWVILPTMKPGAQPVEELAIVLAVQRSTAASSVKPDLESADSRGLHVQSKMISRDSRVVLVIDQFEELFTLTTDEQQRERFINLLTSAATAPDGNLTVILTMRADFSDRPLMYPELGRLISDHSEPVLPMSLAELTEVVLGPTGLEDVRLTFEGDLASRLVYAVREQPGGLPLLQFALDQLFERRDGQTLTIKAYEEIGELKGALAKHADATYAALPSDAHRHMARGLFLRLISPGATEQDSTRRRVMQRELTPAAPEQREMMEALIRTFITARLLTTGEIAGEPTLEVSHEALIREWGVLRVWLDQFRSEVRLQQSISQDAADWLQRGKRPDDLYLGEKLREAEAWMRGGAFAVSAEEAAFIAAGMDRQREVSEENERRIKALEVATARAAQTEQQAQKSRQQLRRAIVIAVVLITLTSYVGYKTFQAQQAAEMSAKQANMQVGYALITLTQAVDQANKQIGNAQSTLENIGTSVAATLTPIPATLTKVAGDVHDGEAQIESLRLAALANGLLNDSDENATTVVLLGIRALKVAYTAQADAVLGLALEHLYDLRTFRGYKARVSSAVFSRDGSTILAGLEDKSAKLWNATTGQEIHTFKGHTKNVKSVAFSPDDSTVLTGSFDQTAKLWDVKTGKELRTFSGHLGPVSISVFSPNGRTILTGSWDGTAKLWDVKTGKKLRTFSGHSNSIYSAAFSPDGRAVVTGSRDRTAKLWDVETGKELRTFSGHSNSIGSVSFSPDGHTILTGSADMKAKLWDVETGKEIRTFGGHTSGIKSVSFSPDGRSIATGSFDSTVKLWNRTTGEMQHIFSHMSSVESVMFSPDGRTLLTGSWDETVKLWGVESGQELRNFVGHTSTITAIVISPDERTMVTGSSDKTAKLWDIETRRQLRTFDGHDAPVCAVAFSSDGRTVLTGSEDQTAKLWDVKTGQAIAVFKGHDAPVCAVAFSSDGRTVLTGSWDKTAKLWDAETERILRTFGEHEDAVSAVAFSPDGRTVLTGSWDKTAKLWDAETGKVLYTLRDHVEIVRAVAFSPNGQTILTGAGDHAKLWDASSGEYLRTFSGHAGEIFTVAFSPNGQTILTGSLDHTAKLWDAISGEYLRTFTPHTGYMSAIALSTSGRFVFAALNISKGPVTFWEIDYNAFINYACTRLDRDLTSQERQQFQIPDPEPTCPQFATTENPITIPFPPTTTPFPVTLPVWTPIASPTPNEATVAP